MPYELLHNGILLYRGGKNERYSHCFAGRMYPYCERKSGEAAENRQGEPYPDRAVWRYI